MGKGEQCYRDSAVLAAVDNHCYRHISLTYLATFLDCLLAFLSLAAI
jgi:hypothetical protein